MSGRPGTASGTRGGGRPTATPLNPFGLDGGGRASDADARDPLADSLARAESLLGRYAGDGGGTARPGTARPGTARPGTARPGTARRDPPTGSIVPPAARHAQPEVLVFDSARDASDSFARDVSASLDDDDASVSFPAEDSSHPEIYGDERSDRSELSDGDGLGFGSDRDVDDDDDDRAAASAASFSVDVDEDVDDASVSFGGAAFVVEEDSFGGDGDDDVDDRPSSPREVSWGDVASARPGTAKGALRPASAPRSDPAFVPRAMGSTIRRGQGGLGSSLSASSGAPPWAGAFDGSALETTAEADESAEMLYDAEEDFAAEALEETSAAIEVASDDDDERDAEIVRDGDGDEDDAFPVGDRPRSSPAGSRSKSPAQLDAEAETEALHGRLRKIAPPPIAVASPPASPKRSSPAPRSPRFSGSPAALEAEADTDALHRTLSGNDPTAALKMEIAKKLRSPETLPPPPPPPAELPPVSPRGGARYPFAQTNAMRVLNDGDDSSSADEVATEGEPTPRASARPQERPRERREERREERPARTDIPDRAVAVARASPARSASPRESRSPLSPRGAAAPSEEESFLLEAIRAARRGAPLDARASAMLAGLVPASEREAETNVAGAARRRSAAEDVSVEAARDARRAFEYVATETLSGETPSGVSGRSPFFSPGAAAAEARALARDDARQKIEEAALASATVGATGRDDWWAFLGGNGGYPGRATQQVRELAAKGTENATEPSISIGDDTTSPELAWAHVLRARSFDGAMRARVASLRVRLRTCVAKAETSRFKADRVIGVSSGSATATAR